MDFHVAGGISDRVARLIAEHISSVEQLETLLLLRSEPERPWTAAEIGSTLRTLPESVALRLADLEGHGLAEPSGDGHRFAATAPADTVDELAEAYRTRRVAVIAMIFAEPEDDPVRSFADAFRLRGDGS